MNIVDLLVDSADIIDNKIIKVDHLVNHNIDIKLLNELAINMADQLRDLKIDKIVTIETDGISIAVLLSVHLGYKDVVYAKKGECLLNTNDSYETEVNTFTKNKVFNLSINKRFLKKHYNAIFVDGFLASGSVYYAIKDLCDQAGENILKSLYIYNKTFQNDITTNVYSIVNVKNLKTITL